MSRISKQRLFGRIAVLIVCALLGCLFLSSCIGVKRYPLPDRVVLPEEVQTVAIELHSFSEDGSEQEFDIARTQENAELVDPLITALNDADSSNPITIVDFMPLSDSSHTLTLETADGSYVRYYYQEDTNMLVWEYTSYSDSQSTFAQIALTTNLIDLIDTLIVPAE